MTFKTIAFGAFLLAVISLGIYWWVSQPTPEERALIGFFDQFRHGHYTEAQDYCANKDFYQVAAKTSVRDTDGSQYLIGDYFPASRQGVLQISIETYVRPHIARWKYLSFDTQILDESSTVVHFQIDLSLRDFNSGDLLGGEIHPGKIEGTAYMKLALNEWKVERFDINVFSDEGLILSPYLRQAH
jgi:hypothetical protein